MIKIKEICINDEKTIEIVESMQKQIKSAGVNATEIEIVRMCIGLAKRMPEKWVVWID